MRRISVAPSDGGMEGVMDKERYAVVKVAVDLANRTITCDPDPVQCYWVAGPADIRWTFPNVPEAVDAVIIEWRKTNNEKYRNKPMFRGQGVARSLSGAHLDDIVTYGNIK